MIEIKTNSNYYLVFAKRDWDGAFAAFAVKCAYDNNLYNEIWERNVEVKFCEQSYSDFKWFKDQILDYVKSVKNFDVNANVNVMILGFCPEEQNAILKIYNLCTAYDCKMIWVDNDLDDITNYKHLNIPGQQTISSDSRAVISFMYLKNVYKDEWIIECSELPLIYDIENSLLNVNNGKYSYDELLTPIDFFLQSLRIELINDNKSDVVSFLKTAVQQPDLIKQKYVLIGTYIKKYHDNLVKEESAATSVGADSAENADAPTNAESAKDTVASPEDQENAKPVEAETKEAEEDIRSQIGEIEKK